MGLGDLLGIGAKAASSGGGGGRAPGADLGSALGGLGTVAGGTAQLLSAQRPGQRAQMSPLDVPQSPAVMPLPQLGAPQMPQNDLASLMQQLQGGLR